MSTVIGMDPSLTAFGISDGARHAVIATPADLPLRERCGRIFQSVVDFHRAALEGADSALWVIEAPLLSQHGKGASHLFEVGYLMSHLDDAAESLGRVRIITVPPPTLRKFATGKGNTPKTEIPLRVYRRWGLEFAPDPGCDKAFAYCLHRYGLALVAGEIEHQAPARRGRGKDATARRRRKAA